MKKILLSLSGIALIVSFAQAKICPEANYDGCEAYGYSIVETEPAVYWPHNRMEVAHDIGIHAASYRRAKRHHRAHRTSSVHRKRHSAAPRRHTRRCTCRCS